MVLTLDDRDCTGSEENRKQKKVNSLERNQKRDFYFSIRDCSVYSLFSLVSELHVYVFVCPLYKLVSVVFHYKTNV